jgi:hypothetical protein
MPDNLSLIYFKNVLSNSLGWNLIKDGMSGQYFPFKASTTIALTVTIFNATGFVKNQRNKNRQQYG